MNPLLSLSPAEVAARIKAGRAVLVDVRERDEYARVHVAGAVSAPLSMLEASPLALTPGCEVVFMCRSGARTAGACDRLAARVEGQAHVLQGGLDGWKKAGLPVRADRRQPLELMRQVQMAAGGLILLGGALGVMAHPAFWGLSAFVGAGLFVAGATGFCGMARLLAVMPWNRAMKRTMVEG